MHPSFLLLWSIFILGSLVLKYSLMAGLITGMLFNEWFPFPVMILRRLYSLSSLWSFRNCLNASIACSLVCPCKSNLLDFFSLWTSTLDKWLIACAQAISCGLFDCLWLWTSWSIIDCALVILFDCLWLWTSYAWSIIACALVKSDTFDLLWPWMLQKGLISGRNLVKL